MLLSRLTLTAKLAAINLLLVASLASVLAVACRILPVDFEATDGVAQLSRAQRANQNADMLHDALHAGLLRALLAGQVAGFDRDRILDTLAAEAAEFRAELRQLAAMSLPQGLHEQTAAASEAGMAYASQVERTSRLAVLDPRQALQAMPEFNRAFEAAKLALSRQTQALSAEMDAAHARARSSADRARLLLVLAAMVAVAVGLGCVAWLARSIRRSLVELRDVARDVAGGNLDRRSNNPGHDEVGQLAASVNQMAANLQDMIDRMREEADRGGFRAELAQALDMADSEPQACEAAGRAMLKISAAHPMELLVADSSESHLARAATHPVAGSADCPVDSPYGCVAVRSGHAMRFPHSADLNACPKLRGRAAGEVSAVCVPVTFMGRALGVLHAVSPAATPITDPQYDRLTALGVLVGGRIGIVRAFERTQLQATTDQLTGLANRRMIEKRMRELMLRRDPFVLVMCDLDHFKRLNDTYGHPAGDQALRTFAEVVRGSVRERDLPGRWGGEEFAFLLAGMATDEAQSWCQRVRERLAATLAQRSTPAFTASFGVAGSTLSPVPDELVRLADEALYRAKRDGRDRIAMASETDPIPETVVPLRREAENKTGVDLRMMVDSR